MPYAEKPGEKAAIAASILPERPAVDGELVLLEPRLEAATEERPFSCNCYRCAAIAAISMAAASGS